jgi:hypothetical protein
MSRHAVLPEGLEDGGGIGGMMIGEVAYTLPWAMWVDTDRRCWLHPHYPARESAGGTVQMRVERRLDGYHVWPPPGNKWSVKRRNGFVGGEDVEFIPVAELHQPAPAVSVLGG